MAYGDNNPAEQSVDFRVYVGMLFFRWQIIVVCFLYCLLGGVIYLQVTPKEFVSRCRLMRRIEENVQVNRPSSPWVGFNSFSYLLRSGDMRARTVSRLADKWGEKIGSRSDMMLPVTVRAGRSFGPTVDIITRSKNSRYAEEFLTTILEIQQPEWESVQKEATRSAVEFLENELGRLQEKIKEAEDDLIEYQRLHDIARVDARGSMEAAYLNTMIGRRSQLSTEIMLLELQYPTLKDENIGVISHAERLTRETGSIEAIEGFDEGVFSSSEETGRPGEDADREEGKKLTPPTLAEAIARAEEPIDSGLGWQDLRVKLTELEQQEKELAVNLQPEHPKRRQMQQDMQGIKAKLQQKARLKLANLQDRHTALKMQLEAVEAAEYKWQNKNLYASQRRAELKRVAAIVSRFEKNYSSVYTRLHDLRVSEELKAESYHMLDPPSSTSKPVYPDAKKILLTALAAGLGSGFGLALVLQVLDNKVQSIKDVEHVLGIPFLGGVPFWVHSGLEKAIRPIVTEERATGAIEAYRALRTAILAALRKVNEKIVIVTSADSREGKTLTTLNLSIMVAEMGKKVLMLDMDLRRGRLHRSLGVEREPGITDVLLKGGTLRDVVRPTRIENLYLAPVGTTIDNSAELLQGCDLVGALVDVQDDYDYIFVDTSPVLRVTDTVILATLGIGVVVYVARVNHTPKPLIRYSLDMLGDSHVLGLIMNSIEMHKISSLYYTYQYPNYAYYSNAYAYGYNYYQYQQSGEGRRHSHRRHSARRRMQSAAKWFRRNFLPLE